MLANGSLGDWLKIGAILVAIAGQWYATQVRIDKLEEIADQQLIRDIAKLTTQQETNKVEIDNLRRLVERLNRRAGIGGRYGVGEPE